MSVVLAIDPGPTRSAWLRLGESGQPEIFGLSANETLLAAFRGHNNLHDVLARRDVLVIEKIEAFGMAVGAEVFETVYWSGQFAEAAHEVAVDRIGRKAVKIHLCGSMRAKDPNIRAALIDRFGPSKEAAIGTKRQPGPLYGIAGDVWSALAVAVCYADGAR